MYTYICRFIDVEGVVCFTWDFEAEDHAEAIGVGLGINEHLEDCEAIEIFLGRVRVFSSWSRVADPAAS